MLRLIAGVGGLILLVCASAPSQASTVSGTYTGFVTELNFGVPVAGAPDIKLSDPYEVDYSYETTAAVDHFGSGTVPDGTSFDVKGYKAGNLSVTVGAFHLNISKSVVELGDFPAASGYADSLDVWSCDGCFAPSTTVTDIPAGWSVNFVFFQAFFDGSTLNGTSLPTSALDPSIDWDDYFQLTLEQVGTGTEYVIVGAKEPLSTTPIPASWALFVTALSGLGLTAWKRRRADRECAVACIG